MCGHYPSRLQQAGKYKLYDLTPCKPDNSIAGFPNLTLYLDDEHLQMREESESKRFRQLIF